MLIFVNGQVDLAVAAINVEGRFPLGDVAVIRRHAAQGNCLRRLTGAAVAVTEVAVFVQSDPQPASGHAGVDGGAVAQGAAG